MNNLDMKNIIVLKDLPSNIIDEAIVVLKNNKIKRKDGNENMDDDFVNINIVEEAQQIIGEYIEKMENTKKEEISERKILIKYKKLQLVTILLGAMMIISFFISFIK